MTVYHLAEQLHWQAALESGSYTQSTRGRSLADEGFIHCSTAQQWPEVRRAFYGDVSEPLVLLEIDESRLPVALVHEVGNPETGELFPHLYAPLPVAAVAHTLELAPPHA
ncbi:DUF952 domain-containing protein [Epidermidibacterium keratini]|uniref:DUF952 domain-containing protein n=1 Tax=Epidermidibacterium keratini TaxID=1891644 RepID=UPI001CEF904D|nr:DUF952 domain-containing protein [Epidermidibacterium keratini]